MDRFLLAENVNKGNNRPLFILQTIKHKMLIEIVPFNSQAELTYDYDDVFDFFRYINPDRLMENYMLIVRDFYDLHSEQAIELNIKKIRADLKKAWNWYKSYLLKEDAVIDERNGLNNPNLN